MFCKDVGQRLHFCSRCWIASAAAVFWSVPRAPACRSCHLNFLSACSVSVQATQVYCSNGASGISACPFARGRFRCPGCGLAGNATGAPRRACCLLAARSPGTAEFSEAVLENVYAKLMAADLLRGLAAPSTATLACCTTTCIFYGLDLVIGTTCSTYALFWARGQRLATCRLRAPSVPRMPVSVFFLLAHRSNSHTVFLCSTPVHLGTPAARCLCFHRLPCAELLHEPRGSPSYLASGLSLFCLGKSLLAQLACLWRPSYMVPLLSVVDFCSG